MVVEIRLHGVGGQGAVLAAHIISIAAFYDGMFSRSFATFGTERRGSPVTSFVMIGERDEMTRSKIYNPDHVVVLDPHLPKFINVTDGVRERGTLTLNTSKSPKEALDMTRPKVEQIDVGVVDATSIAQKLLGKPIMNTTMLGAFTRVTGIVALKSMLKAIESRFEGELVKKNLNAAKLGYDKVKIETFSHGANLKIEDG